MAGKGSKKLFSCWETKAQEESCEYIQPEEEGINFNLDDFGDEEDDLFANANEDTEIATSAPVAYAGRALETIEGFDEDAGRTWIYPVNYPVRDYQFSIVQNALYSNTLVSLPTGLGKTFIAAVVMYNFYRWYPSCKVVFMAPTKPLVAQQIQACFNIMGTPQIDTAEMTGAMAPSQRVVAWAEKRIFFLTPQVLTNDLTRGACPAEAVKCLVLDEAHRATGNHAYCQVVQALKEHGHKFRILALSATPGSDMEAVQKVVSNLMISKIELRSEDSPDISIYTHQRNIDKIVIPLGAKLERIKDRYLTVLRTYVTKLIDMRCIYTKDETTLSKFQILKAREAFRQNPPENIPRNRFGVVEGLFALCMTLYHAYELMLLHGTRSFYKFLRNSLDDGKAGTTKSELLRNKIFTDLMSDVRKEFGDNLDASNNNTILNNSSGIYSQIAGNDSLNNSSKKPYIPSHPKLEKLQEVIVKHFEKFEAEGSSTRVMIFSQYRESVSEITEMLQQHRPLVKAYSFVGQSSSSAKGTRGFTQKEQLQVVKKFREGEFNTLVATCVGEEGLDIGEVDLIVCYDAPKSPIRLVQRMGRTGRKREGRIVVLVTKGKEEQTYNHSQFLKKSISAALTDGSKLTAHFYKQDSRMVPKGLNPICQKLSMSVGEWDNTKKSKRKSLDNKKKSKASGIRQIDSMLGLGDKPSAKKASSFKGGYLSKIEWQWYKDNLCLDDTQEIKTLPEPKMMSLSEQEGDQILGEDLIDLGQYQPWQTMLQSTVHISHSERSNHLVQLTEFLDLQVQIGTDEDPYGMEMATYLDLDYIEDEDRPRQNIADSLRAMKSPKTTKRTINSTKTSKKTDNSPKTSKRTDINNVNPKKSKKGSSPLKGKKNHLITDMFKTTQSQQNRNLPSNSEDIEDFDVPKRKQNNSVCSEKASNLLENESDDESLPDIIFIPPDETDFKVDETSFKVDKTTSKVGNTNIKVDKTSNKLDKVKGSLAPIEDRKILKDEEKNLKKVPEKSSTRSIDEICLSVISRPLSPIKVRTPPREEELDDWDINEPVEKEDLIAIVNQYEKRYQANRKSKLINFTDMIYSGETENEMEIEMDKHNEIETEMAKDRTNEMEIEKHNEIEKEAVKENVNVTDNMDKMDLSYEDDLPDLQSQVPESSRKVTKNEIINLCDSPYKTADPNSPISINKSPDVNSKLTCSDPITFDSGNKASPNLTIIESRSPAMNNLMKPSTSLEIDDDQFVPLSLKSRINVKLGKFVKDYDGSKNDLQIIENEDESTHKAERICEKTPDKLATKCLSGDELSPIISSSYKAPLGKNLALCSTPKVNVRRLFKIASPNLTTIESRSPAIDNVMKPSTNLEIDDDQFVPLSLKSRINIRLGKFAKDKDENKNDPQNSGNEDESKPLAIEVDRSKANSKILENMQRNILERNRELGAIPENSVVQLSQRSRIRGKLKAFSAPEKNNEDPKDTLEINTVSIATKINADEKQNLDDVKETEMLVPVKLSQRSRIRSKLGAFSKQDSDSEKGRGSLESELESFENRSSTEKLVTSKVCFKSFEKEKYLGQEIETLPKSTKTKAKQEEANEIVNFDIGFDDDLFSDISDSALNVPQAKNSASNTAPNARESASSTALNTRDSSSPTDANDASADMFSSSILADMESNCGLEATPVKDRRTLANTFKVPDLKNIEMFNEFATPKALPVKKLEPNKRFSSSEEQTFLTPKSQKDMNKSTIKTDMNSRFQKSLVGLNSSKANIEFDKLLSITQIVDMIDDCATPDTQGSRINRTVQSSSQYRSQSWSVNKEIAKKNASKVSVSNVVLDLESDSILDVKDNSSSSFTPKKDEELTFSLLGDLADDDWDTEEPQQDEVVPLNLLNDSQKFNTGKQPVDNMDYNPSVLNSSEKNKNIEKPIDDNDFHFDLGLDGFDSDDSLLADIETNIKAGGNLLPSSQRNNETRSQLSQKNSLRSEVIILSDDDSPIKRKISNRNNRIEDDSVSMSQPAPSSQLEVSEVWKRRKRKPTNIVESDSDDHNSSSTSAVGKSDDSRNQSTNLGSRNNSMNSRNESANSKNQSLDSRTCSDNSRSSTDHSKEWISKKKSTMTKKNHIDDDDDDFDLETSVSYKKQKPKNTKESLNKKSNEQKAKKKRKKLSRNPFMEHEADISSGEDVSSDESEGDDDEYDNSFVSHGTQLSQDPGVDMQAVYLQSVVDQDLAELQHIKRKMLPRHEILSDSTSVSGEEEEDSCDSFVVENDFVEYNSEWMGDTMLAEDSIMIKAMHDNGKKQKEKKDKNKKGKSTSKSAGNNKRKRIITHDTSSEDEAKIEKKCKVSKSSENIPIDIEVVGSKNKGEVFKPKLNEKSSTSGPSKFKSNKQIITSSISNQFNFDLDFDADDSLLSDMQMNMEMGEKLFKNNKVGQIAVTHKDANMIKPTPETKTMENKGGKMLAPEMKNNENNWQTPKLPAKKSLLSKSRPKRNIISPDREIQSSHSKTFNNFESSEKSKYSSEGFNTDEMSENWENKLPKPMSDLNVSKIKSQSITSKSANDTLQSRSSLSDSTMNVSSLISAANTSSVNTLNKSNNKQTSQLSKAHMLVASTEISGANAIVSSLRHRHGLDVSVVQLEQADYVVSTRMAVIRQLYSVFSSASHKTKLVQSVQALLADYERPVVIVEADRVKPGESPRQNGRNKYLDTIVSAFAQVTQLKLLYSNNQGETSDILKSLTEQECSKQHGIPVSSSVLKHLEQKIVFYRTFPEVSYPTALCLANAFPKIADLIKSSVALIQGQGRMSESRALALHTFLHRAFRRDMLPPSARR